MMNDLTEDNFVILGENADQYRKFYSITISPNSFVQSSFREGVTEKFSIGLISQDLVLTPQMLFIPERDSLLFGLNDELTLFGLSVRTVQHTVSLERSPFHSLTRLTDPNLVLVFHEIGVLAVNLDNEILWRHDRDVITESTLSDNQLRLTFMDEPPETIDIQTGKLLRYQR